MRTNQKAILTLQNPVSSITPKKISHSKMPSPMNVQILSNCNRRSRNLLEFGIHKLKCNIELTPPHSLLTLRLRQFVKGNNPVYRVLYTSAEERFIRFMLNILRVDYIFVLSVDIYIYIYHH